MAVEMIVPAMRLLLMIGLLLAFEDAVRAARTSRRRGEPGVWRIAIVAAVLAAMIVSYAWLAAEGVGLSAVAQRDDMDVVAFRDGLLAAYLFARVLMRRRN